MEHGSYEDTIGAVLLRIKYIAEGAGQAADAQEWADVLCTVTTSLPEAEPGFCRECGENPCECESETESETEEDTAGGSSSGGGVDDELDEE